MCIHISSHSCICIKKCLFLTPLWLPASKTDGTVRLQREVVLLTDDRNLRVKALTRNVPVRDIPSFLSWAKVGWTRVSLNTRNPTAEVCLSVSQDRRHTWAEEDNRGQEMIKKVKNHFLWKTSKCRESRVVSISFSPLWQSKCVYVCVKIRELPWREAGKT